MEIIKNLLQLFVNMPTDIMCDTLCVHRRNVLLLKIARALESAYSKQSFHIKFPAEKPDTKRFCFRISRKYPQGLGIYSVYSSFHFQSTGSVQSGTELGLA